MNNKALIWVVVVLVILVGGYFLFFQGDQVSDSPGVDVMEDFGSKVVYSTNVDQDPAPFRADCNLRGGTFNECGSICEPDADFCAEVCAYTCDDIQADEQETATTTTTDETATTTDGEATTTGEASN